MTTNNTWPAPARPGVPLNPKKDGWHWVQHGNGAIVPRFWRCDHWEGVGHSGITPIEPSEAAIAWTYLGPVLLPDEATALQARADRNAAGFARVDAEAERAKFLHKRDVEALQARVAELEGLVRIVLENDVLVLAKENIVLPGSFTFEKISKLNAWRNKARAALEGKKDEL